MTLSESIFEKVRITLRQVKRATQGVRFQVRRTLEWLIRKSKVNENIAWSHTKNKIEKAGDKTKWIKSGQRISKNVVTGTMTKSIKFCFSSCLQISRKQQRQTLLKKTICTWLLKHLNLCSKELSSYLTVQALRNMIRSQWFLT